MELERRAFNLEGLKIEERDIGDGIFRGQGQ